MPAVTHEQIEALALASGFEPKPQPDGSMALHPHVFEFARQLLAAGQSLPVIDKSCCQHADRWLRWRLFWLSWPAVFCCCKPHRSG